LLCGRPLDDYLVWLDVQQISAKPFQLNVDLNLSSRAAAPAAQRGRLFATDRPPPCGRDPDAHDLNRAAASHRHLALRCRELAPDEAGQHVAFEAMNVDEQCRVDATAAAREKL